MTKNEINKEEIYSFPTSFAQQRLWFLDQFEPDSPFYNIPTAVRIKGPLDIPALQDTIDEIVYRHESLRTTFGTENGKPVQIIHPDMECPVEIIDLCPLAFEKREAEALRMANNEARMPFSLKTGPLFRARLILLKSDESIMLVTMHHIISDGWSIGVFMREVTIIYQAFSAGQDSPLPELEIQYADFSSWQRDWLKGDVLENQLAYWKNKLSDIPILELPTDKPRPAIQSSRGANYSTIIPKKLSDDLKAFCRKHGITPFMGLLSAFYILLNRYTGQEDIAIGTPIANRTQAQTEALIGFFINTLVLRVNLHGNPTVKEFLQQVRRSSIEGQAHQDLPFEMLVEAVQPQRSMSHSPLFQVMFILQNATDGGTQNVAAPKSAIRMEQIEVDAGTSTFDLTISIAEQTKGLHTSVEYCTDLFERETIERFVAQYQVLLEAMLLGPDAHIADLDVLSPKDKQLILHDWNATRTNYDWRQCMHKLVETHAEKTPEAIAVVAPGNANTQIPWPRMSYRQLNSRANQLARALREQGIGPETAVGISLEKSLDLAVAVLAVLKAGGGYVPMDPDYPRERLAYMMDDSRAPLIITRSELISRLPHTGAVLFCIDKHAEKLSTFDDANPTVDITPSNMAYMIYTSGTTGKAKGTIVSHQSWVNSFFAWQDAYELRDRCRSHLQMANFSFDVFAGDFIRALASGGKLTLIPRETLLSAEALYRQMLQEKVSIAEFVPAVLRNLTTYLETIGKDLSFMRCLIAGSDAWYVGEYKQFLDYGGPETRLINSFGLTEAAIDTTYFEASQLDLPRDRLVPIGHPFSNMQVYILDTGLQPVPIGVAGEIFVGGAGVARGYHMRPGLTAEKFIPDPFSRDAGARLYRTGDKGKYLADGNIEFMGRLDHQVKLRGFRIEMGEIESGLSAHPLIEQAAVIVREDTHGDKRLVAYFTLAGVAGPDRAGLRSFLLDTLPDYMIPNAFVQLDKIPLTPNGKVDRKALPRPDESDYGSMDVYVGPRNGAEEKMAAIWASVLGLEQVGVQNNFFDLGGHSLLATQLISRVRESFDVELPLRFIFEYPTVAGLTEQAEIAAHGTPRLKAPPILAVSRDQKLPLSFAQQRLWFLDQLEPGNTNYNIPEAVRLKGNLDGALFAGALNFIVDRHESLRTNFISDNGRPRLVIHDKRPIELEQFDLRGLPSDTREEKAMELANAFANTLFHLDEGPLLRVGLVRLQEDVFFLLATIHHIISDEWSTQVFIRELGFVYEALSRDEKPQLPPLPIQYADFAQWQQSWLRGTVLDEQVDYWKNVLSDTPQFLDLPTDHTRPKVQTINGDYTVFKFSDDESARINDFARQHGVTLFMLLLSGFETLLYRYSGQEKFNIGTPIANRNHGEIEPLIGFFVNTLVMRADLSERPTFKQVLQRVRETALGAYAHQDVPFEKIVEAMQPDRDLAHSPLFQVMFVLQNDTAPTPAPADDRALIISPIETKRDNAKFDLTLFMQNGETGIGGAMEFNTDLFEKSTVARFLEHYRRFLLRLISLPRERIDALPLTDAAEQQILVHDLNRFETNTLNGSIKEIFETQARLTPTATALRWQGTLERSHTLNYAELNRRANYLAAFLTASGLGRDQLIGVCFKRSPEMIIAILAVIKAGAAYVPIDPVHPRERLRYIVRDAGLDLILGHGPTRIALEKIGQMEELPQVAPAIKTLTLRMDDESLTRRTLLLDFNDFDTHSFEINSKNPVISIDPDHLVYMIYTSGSTGRPKGTLITHGGLLHYLNWTVKAYPLNQGDGSLIHSTIAFDATVTALFTPFLTGKSVTLASSNNDLEALADALLHYKNFSLVKITPAHLDLLSRQIPAEKAAGLSKAFVIGGENLLADAISFWQQNAPETHLFNEYGPTETVVGSVVFDAMGKTIGGSVPIGRSIPNAPVYVLDNELNPVPQGLIGELFIGGKGTARGYHNRPALTAERFIPDPFSKQVGARIYKTGDLVRYNNNRQLVFIGRIDEQVKIRGYRIEPGEIENTLLELNTIEDAVIHTWQGKSGDKRLIAYIVTSEKLNIPDLKKNLKSRLPEYMVPAFFVRLESLPLTSNGKVDRGALPEPELSREQSTAVFIAPKSDDEKQLAKIWQEILQLKSIGINDNFFDLGGHSLLATQMMSRIQSVFDVELPLRVLFEQPTIAGIIYAVRHGQQSLPHDIPPIMQMERTGDLPLSFAQQRLWFLDQLTPGNPNYNIPSAFRIHGPLDSAVLEKAVNMLMRRHESLHTSFYAVNGIPHQVIDAPVEIKLTIEEMALPEGTKGDEEILKVAAEFARTVFDLSNGPLFRIKLVRLSAEDFVLLLNMHHIISDGWSTTVMIREIGILYQACRSGLPSPLPELPVHYADYAIWQRNRLKDEILQHEIGFWREALGSDPPVLNMPTDFPRPANQTFNGDTCGIQIDAGIYQGLQTLARENKATLFMAMLAAWQILLHKYSQQETIFCGTPIANRTQVQTEPLIGFFVNTLVMRADFLHGDNFEQLLKRIRDFSLNAYAHQDVPFEHLVDALQNVRDMSHSPLFQVLFTMQNNTGNILPPMGDLTIAPVKSDAKIAKFDLSLSLIETDNGIAGELEFNTDLFLSSTARRLLEHYQLVLEQIVAAPHTRIDDLHLLSDVDSARIRKWNQTSITLPGKDNIAALFEQRVQRDPEKQALVFGEQSLTFRQLNDRANQLAAYLQKMGVRPETHIGISLERSPEMVVALLGVIKSGGVYVPIDPNYPLERIEYIIDDAAVRILFSHPAVIKANRLPLKKDGLQIIDLGALAPQLKNMDTSNPSLSAAPENLVYIIYTSGSTGRPKGTMISHGALCNLTLFQIKDFQLNESSRALQFASFSFDASVSEIFTTLISGACLVLGTREQLMPGPGLVRLLKEQEISVLTLPPSVSVLLKDETFPALKTLVSAGEALRPDLARHWARGRRLLNAYGPTENTVCSTSRVVDPGAGGALIPIGGPIDNVRVYILDFGDNPVPPGVPGEMCLSGDSLARGYFQRPGLTAEKFIPDNFSGENGARLYRTGDRARWLEDGSIEFLGRIDQQVKLRGFRIEPGEIESLILANPSVRDAVVTVREDTPGDPRLVAYYVGINDTDIAEDLRDDLRRRLPDYMVPSAFARIESIPLTPNGKVDKRALPKVDLQSRVKYVAPRTPREEQLCAIWQEVLTLEKVGIYDNFFEIGGHSLLATQVTSRIRDAFAVELELRYLFEAPTIAGLVPVIEEIKARKKTSDEIPLIPVDRGKPIPLSFAQQRLWFLDQLAPDNAFYNIPASLRHRGKLDIKAFEKTVRALIMRHETLRTTFSLLNGFPVQVIHEAPISEVDLTDLRGYPQSQREDEARRMVDAEAAEPFDLELGPLFRSRILILDDKDHIVLFTMHHVISDGWSVSVLVREFAILYEAFSHHRAPSLPNLPIQYADYAYWQRQWLKDDALQRQIDFWKEQIGINPEPIQLPLDYMRPAVQTFNGETETLLIPEELHQKLLQLTRENGATLFMTLLAIFQTLLHRYSGQDEILVGSPIANRTRSETEGLIGFFVNTLVFKNHFYDDPDFTTLLQRVRTTTLAAYSHQDLPFEQLVEIVHPERDLSHSPIFQVMFVMQNTPSGEVDVSDARISPIEARQKIAKYDLSVIAMETADGIVADFEYNTDLFRPETIRRMQGHFLKLIRQLTDDPLRPVSYRSLITSDEGNLIINEWNNTRTALPDFMLAQTLFEQRALQSPRNTALVFKGKKLSFKELNRRANQLAHFLREQGVGPEIRVAISVERSMEMVIGLLAILKAGGVYVPIDPGYPAERINYIINDCRAALLLTTEEIAPRLQPASEKLFLIDQEQSTLKSYSKLDLTPRHAPDNLAYIIYTSGSTGRPKGTMLTHRGLCNLTLEQIKDFKLDEKCRCLQFASFSFDASVSEIFTTLVSGATLYLVEKNVLMSGGGLIKTLKKEKITTVTLPPSLLAILQDENFPHLKMVISAGEALPRDLAANWIPKSDLLNAYGPTENTVCASSFAVSKIGDYPTVPIGRPIGNVDLFVLDENCNLLPPGVPGDLYISGINLARGYLNRPGLTAERFLPNPFTDEPGTRMYLTGDRARWLFDGNLEFAGRSDTQLKIRGFRIEPGEIESRLRALPEIQEAVVTARVSAQGKILIAYCVPVDDKPMDNTSIRAILRKELPDYMVPAIFVAIDQVPLTPNGKVDFKSLLAPDVKDLGNTAEKTAPRNKTEEKLVAIWQKTLGITEIGVTDNFFDLGGHSLLAMKLLADIEKNFGEDITLVDFFQDASIESLARLLTEENTEKSGVKVIELAKGETNKPALFFIHPSGGAIHHYQELAARLDSGHAFYGVQAQGLDGKMPLHKTIPDMAKAYISAIKKIQPNGPYILGSWSLGVIISYEMARQLDARGEITAFLFQFDQGPFVEHKSPKDTAEMLTEMFKRYFKIDTEKLRNMEESEQFKVVLKKAKKVKVVPRFVRVADFQRYITVNETQIQAWLDYKAGPYPGTVTLFRSEENRDKGNLDWDKLADRVTTIDVPGDHIQMLQNPQVGVLAEKLSKLLRKSL